MEVIGLPGSVACGGTEKHAAASAEALALRAFTDEVEQRLGART